MAEIKKYHKPLNINIGMVIFAAIFIYVCICISMYFRTSHIRPYEVREGSLASDKLYTGIALREETVVEADSAGYVNYYVREGERAACGDLVYTTSASDTTALKSRAAEDVTLSESELSQLKSDVINFTHGFSEEDFGNTYNFKYSMKSAMLKFTGSTLLNELSSGNSGLRASYAPSTGIVMYWTDGLEGITADDITAEDFDSAKHAKNQLLSNEMISAGAPAYKICDTEEWAIVIKTDAATAADLEAEGYVKVRFLKNQLESWGAVSLISGADQGTYVKLTFNNSMVTFSNERYLEIELLVHDETGLKIPNTSIAQREFYLIPTDFVTLSGDGDSYGVLRDTILENGNKSTEYVTVSIYSEVNGKYYVDADALRSGDVLHATDSTRTCSVSEKATLTGVYNMNKGYADFRQIEILYQNEEYAIVKSNTDYGLNVYDLIVQDASTVTADQFIYR